MAVANHGHATLTMIHGGGRYAIIMVYLDGFVPCVMTKLATMLTSSLKILQSI